MLLLDYLLRWSRCPDLPASEKEDVFMLLGQTQENSFNRDATKAGVNQMKRLDAPMQAFEGWI